MMLVIPIYYILSILIVYELLDILWHKIIFKISKQEMAGRHELTVSEI